MKGKLIVIEGSDGAGKGTQTKLLIDYLKKNNQKVETLHFPNYDCPTGKIVAGPYLGHEEVCKSYFSESSTELDSKIVAMYFAADFKYNMDKLKKYLEKGTTIVLDRYVESTMAYQAGIIEDKTKRHEMYKWIEKLNYEMLDVPRPDAVIFLSIPIDKSKELRNTRDEKLDKIEQNTSHISKAAHAYEELYKIYDFKIVNCLENNKIRSIESIHKDVVKIYNEII